MARRSRRRMTFTSAGRDFSFPSRRLPPRRFSISQDVADYGPFSRSADFPPTSRSSSYKAGLRPRKRPAERWVDQYSALAILQTLAPSRALHCVRRKLRREVLFALRRAGFSGSAPKREYNRTADSQWRC